MRRIKTATDEAYEQVFSALSLYRDKKERGPGVGIYHEVRKRDSFEDAAAALTQLVADTARKYPGKDRHLYLDIQGHRNEQGGFDSDMAELQGPFLLGFLCPYLTSMTTPLCRSQNNLPQRDDVPGGVIIKDSKSG